MHEAPEDAGNLWTIRGAAIFTNGLELSVSLVGGKVLVEVGDEVISIVPTADDYADASDR